MCFFKVGLASGAKDNSSEAHFFATSPKPRWHIALAEVIEGKMYNKTLDWKSSQTNMRQSQKECQSFNLYHQNQIGNFVDEGRLHFSDASLHIIQLQ